MVCPLQTHNTVCIIFSILYLKRKHRAGKNNKKYLTCTKMFKKMEHFSLEKEKSVAFFQLLFNQSDCATIK